MISFIVIGKNEGKRLKICINSIYDTIVYNNILNFEIIYIDSNSNDGSILNIKNFKGLKIFAIKGPANAAIARNIGASEANGNILFFIDGDMELIPKALRSVIINDEKLQYCFISGQFINCYYNKQGVVISEEIYHKINKDTYMPTTGGLFLITKQLWNSIGGMKPKYRRSQDLDFGLRASKKGKPLLRKKEILAKHHTIYYYDNQRLWWDIFNLNELYSRSLLYRDHLFNKKITRILIRSEYSLILLVLTIGMSFILSKLSLFIPYFLVLIGKVIYKKFKGLKCIELILYYLLRDLMTLLGFVFFWPNRKFTIKYVQIQ